MTKEVLKAVLGGPYGGPSISYEDGKFILYEWGDAPTGTYTLEEDTNWEKFLSKLAKRIIKGNTK